MIAVVALSLFYLGRRFVYTPLHAESIYRLGYERIFAGDYLRAKDRFYEAFALYPKKSWFYKYAEAFRDERQYTFASEKYDELLRHYPRDKKGVLDYASMETNYLFDYKKADDLIRSNILDYAVNDREGLLARGDNALEWGGIEPERYEIARESYARYRERYGTSDPLDERMLKYFIRTDDLGYVLPLQAYFMQSKKPGEPSKTKIGAATLAELGGYLLDKKLEEVRGVPNQYIEKIDGIYDILLRAVRMDPAQPEPHYHLARYYNYLGSETDERVILETALKAFDMAQQESAKRIDMRIDAQRRYAHILTANHEFIPAETQLV
jgi:tetratricopeptide (TPR) repeat protein